MEKWIHDSHLVQSQSFHNHHLEEKHQGEEMVAIPSSTTTSLSDERNTGDSVEEKNNLRDNTSNSFNVSITVEGCQNSGASPDTPTSKKETGARDEKESKFTSRKEKEINSDRNTEATRFGQVFSAPLGNINMEAEQSAMQQQIVDMYTRSMQQFTESLAKMKLPMDLDKPESEGQGDVVQNHNSNKLETDKKKDGSRVFYGSRAFF